MELGTESNCVSLSHNNTTHSCDNGIASRPAHPNSDVPATQTSHDDVSVHQSPAVWDTGTGRRTSRTGAVDDQREGSHRAVRSLILIMSLSLHHLFEGMSMGLHRSVAGVFTLLIALLCHETIISFSLGLQFVKCSYTPKQHYVTAFACSIVEPIGVAVGMVMSEVSEPSTAMGIVDGVLQALATGTFIFVTFFEILQEEIDPHDTSISKVTSALAGFIVMSCLMLVSEDTSSTDEHSPVYSTVDPVSNYLSPTTAIADTL